MLIATTTTVNSFIIPQIATQFTEKRTSRRSVELNAIGVLARKAKEMDVRKYVESGVPDDVMAKYNQMKEASKDAAKPVAPGPVQTDLTKRKGTITVIAEYKRKLESGYIDEIVPPDILSSTFREFGATAVSVMTDERMGGCSYDDIGVVVKEQETARGDVPGPLKLISNDLIVDEIQIARAAAAGANAVTVNLDVVGEEMCANLIKMGRSIDIETIVNVATVEEAQKAVDIGANMICVCAPGADEKVAILNGMDIPEGASVCTIASIIARDNKQLEEVEEAWVLRDQGFNAVWAADCLYKSGNDPNEHAGAIIRSMKAKSSVKWASAMAKSGRGEGSREYLGDIMM